MGTEMIAKKEEYSIVNGYRDDDSFKKLNISKKKKFTIVEGIKLFEILSSNNTDNLNRTSFW